MKKKIFLGLCMAMCLFTGCAQKAADTKTVLTNEGDTKKNTEDSTVQQEADEKTDTAENPFSGTYTVPEGWVKSEKYSTQDKWFYIEEGQETKDNPDNIAINIGNNRYAKEEHTQFRDAIMKQLLPQVKGQKAELNGEGVYTEQGDVLYIFTIIEDNPKIVTKQYYIVGDHRYCLMQLTNFTGSEDVNQAATEMAKSFTWE